VPPDSSLIVRLVEWRDTLCCAPRYLENVVATALALFFVSPKIRGSEHCQREKMLLFRY
jgi:hypothetical protein